MPWHDLRAPQRASTLPGACERARAVPGVEREALRNGRTLRRRRQGLLGRLVALLRRYRSGCLLASLRFWRHRRRSRCATAHAIEGAPAVADPSAFTRGLRLRAED